MSPLFLGTILSRVFFWYRFELFNLIVDKLMLADTYPQIC